MSNLPPSRATRSLMPESPNESFRASASSTLNPTPLSSTASLTHPSADRTEMLTLFAPECLARLLQHSEQQTAPDGMEPPEPVHQLPQGRLTAKLLENRRPEGGDQTAHFQNGA